MLSYVGHLAIERNLSPDSLSQYLSAVSRYHELYHLPSPTNTPPVRVLQKAYQRTYDNAAPPRDIRVGFLATLMRNILLAEFRTSDILTSLSVPYQRFPSSFKHVLS